MTPSPLLTFISSARWFGGKGRRPRLVGVTPLPWLRSPGEWPAVRCEIAEIGYPDGDTEHYQLLLGYRPEQDQPDPLVIIDDPDHGRLAGVDATADPILHAALLETIMTGRQLSAGASVLIGHRLGVGPRDRLTAGLPSRVFGGEQSNTSILYGDVALLKIFRRLQPGANPDIEIHQRLTHSGNRSVATLFGWLAAEPPDAAGRTDLAMLVEQLPQARDGWELALAAVADDQDLSRAATELGAALAEIHRDLRAEFGSDRVDGAELADAMTTRIAAAALVVPDLEPISAPLGRLLDRLRTRTIAVQRVHGDFHLGQTLLTPAGWKIIDFEGEPAKTMAERLKPDSIWRDIAGALRSIDYAAAHRGDETGERWAASCRQAFLDGYAGPGRYPNPDRPHDLAAHEEQSALLPAYLADKAIYEVVYEARNRPDWVHIPLAAVTELAAGAES